MAQIRQRLQKGEITEAEAQAELKQLRQTKPQLTSTAQSDRTPQSQSSEKQPTVPTTQAKETPRSQTPQKATPDQTGPLQQKTNNLDELYVQAEAAQQDLSRATTGLPNWSGVTRSFRPLSKDESGHWRRSTPSSSQNPSSTIVLMCK
jgi:hypothetical protein